MSTPKVWATGDVVTAADLNPVAAQAAYAMKPNANLAGLASKATARANLDIKNAATRDVGTAAGTVAAGNDPRLAGAMLRTNNLTDLPDVAAARAALAIDGPSTVWPVGTAAGTVAAGNDSRLAGVRAFGAVGDGTTDDTAAIQAAADALAGTGGVLLFPPGTYRRTAPIVLPISGARVIGQGGARIVRLEGFSNDWVFVNPNQVTESDYDDTTTPAIQTDGDYYIEGLTFESITICQFLFAKRVVVRNCFGDFSNAAPASFMQMRGCDDILIEGNTALFCSAGADIWQGSGRIKIVNNNFKVFENVSALGNKYGIGVNALGSTSTGNLRNVPQTVDDVLIEGNSIEVNGTAYGINFDTLGNGCVSRNIRVLNNRVIGASGVNNYGIFGRGDIREIKIIGNQLEGISGSPIGAIHVGGFFNSVATVTNEITTASGSSLVVVKYPNHFCAVGGWVRVDADPSGGPTADVGGVVLNGYYQITAISAGAALDANATVTIESGQTASSTATGGGAIRVVGYFGNPVGGEISGNTLVNCENPAGALINAQGTALTVTNNDMTKCDPAEYASLTFTDQLDRTASATQWGAIVFGNAGQPGTGYPTAANDARNAYVGRPLIIEARNETDVPSWWIKGPVTFADRITLPDEAVAWTPTLTFGGSSTGITYSTQIGTYARIGNMVYIECLIVLINKGSATGAAQIAGLPFTSARSQFGTFSVVGAANFNTITVAPAVRASSATITLNTAILGGSSLTNAEFANNTNLSFCGWYRVA
jgi:hypothetical protein